jgi:AT-rich interactive domain-containing protein 1
MLVSLANIAGHLELCNYDEIISRPVLDGLLHWAVCPSAHGQDPFPTISMSSSLSPQRLALEALCKLCVTDANVDLVIATPPFSRLEKLCAVLTRQLCKNEDQVLREFSVNLLHYLAAADSTMARTVAKQNPCVSYLVAFIEQAEQTALGVANNHGINFLRENPDSMGTSLDMLRRAAGTLLHLSRHPDNRPLFIQQEQRLLGLVMSHILDQQVAMIISKVLFQCSRGPGPLTTTPHEAQNQFATIPGCTSNSNNPNSTQIANNKGQPSMPMAMNPMQQPFGPNQPPPFMQQPTAIMAQPNNSTANLRPHSIQPVLPQGGPLRLADEAAAKTNNKLNPKSNPVPTLPTAVPTTIAPTTNQSNPTTTVSPAANIQQTVTASS